MNVVHINYVATMVKQTKPSEDFVADHDSHLAEQCISPLDRGDLRHSPDVLFDHPVLHTPRPYNYGALRSLFIQPQWQY